MTGSDLLDKLSTDQTAAYLDGAVEMLAYSMSTQGLGKEASCLTDWYFKGNGPADMIGTLKAHPDLPVAGVLQAVVKHICGTAR